MSFRDFSAWIFAACLFFAAIGWGMVFTSLRHRNFSDTLRSAFMRNGLLFALTMTPAAAVLLFVWNLARN